MTRIIEDLEAHYETHEVPFGRSYEWHPEQVAFECNCGQRSTVTATSPTTTRCRCGADHGGIVRSIRRRESRLPYETLHPWLHDTKEQSQQRHRDEAAYPEGSPWRYNDVTSADTHDA